ncbi:MAG: hypothetical protein NTV25_04715 [Methanothrix sp.]|nr:hypothetical protein [Methanothrix sp.]
MQACEWSIIAFLIVILALAPGAYGELSTGGGSFMTPDGPSSAQGNFAVNRDQATDYAARLYPNQTASEAAANMTYVLGNMPSIGSAYVQIKSDLCLFEITAPSQPKADWDEVAKVVADLYATYMEQHPNYSGNLTLNMYTISDGPTRCETITIKPTRPLEHLS